LLHTFATTVDLSAYGFYDFYACTMLTGDENTNNDCKTKNVENIVPDLCLDDLYSLGCQYGDGLVSWVLADVTVNSIECANGDPYDWYHDFTDMSHSFEAGMEYTLIADCGATETFLDVWIDFNDDQFLSDDEHIVNDFYLAVTGVFYEIPFAIPTDASGTHLMRYRTNWYYPMEGSCDAVTYGNMCDFTADISGNGVGDLDNFDDSTVGVSVFPNPASKLVNIQSDFEIINVKIYNYAGQIVKTENVGARVSQINISELSQGVYLFQINTLEGMVSKHVIIE